VTDSTSRGGLEATCREVIDFLLDYLEGELDADRRRAFERHLAECPSCVAYLDSYRATIELARGAERAAPPLEESVALRLARAIRAGRPE
jgi:anti-sigma factor RsiW